MKLELLKPRLILRLRKNEFLKMNRDGSPLSSAAYKGRGVQ